MIEIILPVVCTVCDECFTNLRRDQKEFRRALRTTIFILKQDIQDLQLDSRP